jgi:protein-L-isoaspartate(D-aspartate) O-methyltransferase
MEDSRDTFRHKGLRKKMVESLQENGITDKRVLEAMNKIPRHLFIDSIFEDNMYQDVAFQIGASQTISKPSTVAYQSQLMDVQKGEKILEIGTGSGYQTSVLCELGAKVFSIERHKILHTAAKSLLESMGYRPRLHFGDGYEGLPHFAPFDKVLVTCGASDIPKKLVEQLKIGGKMIIPIGEDVQKMYELIKLSDGDVSLVEYGEFKFVPMLNKKVSV